MQKIWVKKGVITFGVLAVVLLIANFVLNFWLQERLPNYIKNNTDYRIDYNRIDVDLATGNVLIKGLKVENKNPHHTSKIGIEGHIDTLRVSRFGIFDALIRKKISTSEVQLSRPNLTITLAKPDENKQDKKINTLPFKNITISNGTISILKFNQKNYLSVNNLNLSLENLELTDNSQQQKLPFSVDEYRIKAQNFYFQPDDVYAFHIQKIKTEKEELLLDGFAIKSLISIEEFQKRLPLKNKLYSVDIQEVKLKRLFLKYKKIALDEAYFTNPVVEVFNLNSGKNQDDKVLDLDINIKNFKVDHLNLGIMNKDGKTLFRGKDLSCGANDLIYNKQASKGLIPFRYGNFKFKGKDIIIDNGNEIKISSINFNPKWAKLDNILMKSEGDSHLTINKLTSSFNDLKVNDTQLKIEVNQLFVDGLNGTFKQKKKVEPTKKSIFSGIQYQVNIQKFDVKNSNAVLNRENQSLVFKNLNAQISGISIESDKNGMGKKTAVQNYTISTDNVGYQSKFYKYNLGRAEISKNQIKVNQFTMQPLYSRAQFIKMIPVERDLYAIKANQISAKGNWDLFSTQKNINAQTVLLDKVDAVIFRSKIPLDDPKIKPLYSTLLRSLNLSLYIDNLLVKESNLVYEEDTPKSSGPGKLSFSNFNMKVKNLNSAKIKGKPTKVDIDINCRFMNSSPMALQWDFDTADLNDKFSIAGNVKDISANSLNSFIVPYLSVSATGSIQEMVFNFNGNPKEINGDFKLKHQNLKIAILDKNSKEKKKFLSAVANLFIKSNSDRFPESVEIKNVERDNTKSFFNLFWRGLQDGLKKTLIGKNSGTTRSNVRKLATSIKETKSQIKETKESVKSIKEKWKGIKRNFKKDKSKDSLQIRFSQE